MEYAVECVDLVKVYGSGEQAVKALDGVTLRVREGAIFGLFGPNGAGKSTLLSILIGLTLPTSGEARVLGLDVVKQSRDIRRQVGLLPEGFGFYEHMTARQNLEYIAKLNDIRGEEAKKRIDSVLEMVNLDYAADMKVKAFSRGMKQRLGLAQALLKDPRLLLLDEPTLGLDPVAAREFMKLLEMLAKEGRTIIVATHLLRELAQLFDHAAIIVKGRIVIEGSVEELKHKMLGEKRIYVLEFKRETGGVSKAVSSLKDVVKVEAKGLTVSIESKGDMANDLLRLAVENGWPVRRFEERLPSLEEVFNHFVEEVGGNE